MTLRTALLQGVKLLEDAGIAEPRMTAEVLLAHAVGHDRPWLIAHAHDELVELWWIHYGRYLHQRIEETEHLIEAALAVPASSILDVGAGSGCIAITLALETKARVTATDISPAALQVAKANAERLGAQVRFVECDLIPEGKFDLIVSNPPYVALTDKPTLQREVRDHEPELALYGGADGLEVYRRLIPAAERALNPNGWLMMEIGATQADAVSAMLASWRCVEIGKDLAGLPRVVIARF
jgi:release factor glutamine methyltransferase